MTYQCLCSQAPGAEELASMAGQKALLSDRCCRTAFIGHGKKPGAAAWRLPWKSFEQSKVYLENGGSAIMKGHAQRALWEETRYVLASELRFTHHRISPQFCCGQHRGQPLRMLVEALDRGDVTPQDLCMLGVPFKGRIHVLNNRRLKAFQEHEQHRIASGAGPVVVPILVFSLCPMTAKFILSYSTTSDGMYVDVGY
eukprot:gb/GFBE01060985.1/.p1 GENE.gb/GFBE01060985.1/~~gb/GFBE01060985.1/.p1  ORF type:complete len:198 (+),score=24.72 gb/GFBE01060985.1/:1-594(+)